jgi:hypothetical protein
MWVQQMWCLTLATNAVVTYGTHSVDVDSELAKLHFDGYRPLRAITVEQGG